MAFREKQQEKKPWRRPRPQQSEQRREAMPNPGPQAHQTFEQVERMGPAMNPLAFEPPHMLLAARDRNAFAVGIENHFNQDPPVSSSSSSSSSSRTTKLCKQGVIYHVRQDSSDANYSQIGYWPVKKLQQAIYGFVWACVEVRKVDPPITSSSGSASFWEPVHRQPTIAMKILDLRRISEHTHTEDPLKEISAMQYLHQPAMEGEDTRGRECILESKLFLYDTESLYCIMPFCQGGDLFDVVGYYSREHAEENMGMPEPVARYCFRQILWGLHYLQSKGICHRDLSLENVLMDGDVCKIIDFGMALRIPYHNYNTTSMNSTHGLENSGSPDHLIRCLMLPQGTCGKRRYMSPEIKHNRENIDGFAVDLWCVGVMLFMMLTGTHLYESSDRTDIVFCFASTRGELNRVLRRHLGICGLSDSAVSLMQNMLHENPRHRLTLAQVMTHEWTVAEPVRAPYLEC